MDGTIGLPASADSLMWAADRYAVSVAVRDGWPEAPGVAIIPGAVPPDIVHVGHFATGAYVARGDGSCASGRLWATLAVDACTLMVAGISFSLGRPDAAAVAECLEVAMLPKEALLAGNAVAGEWPVSGRIGAALLDRGAGMSDPGLARFCRERGIALPNLGQAPRRCTACVERVAGYVNARIPKAAGPAVTAADQACPGAKSRRALPPGDAQALILDIVVNGYHLATHPVLGMSPLERWTQAALERPTRFASAA